MSFEKSIETLSENFKNHNLYKENYEFLMSLPIVKQLKEENRILETKNKKLILFIINSIVKSEENSINTEKIFNGLFENEEVEQHEYIMKNKDPEPVSSIEAVKLSKRNKKRPSLRSCHSKHKWNKKEIIDLSNDDECEDEHEGEENEKMEMKNIPDNMIFKEKKVNKNKEEIKNIFYPSYEHSLPLFESVRDNVEIIVKKKEMDIVVENNENDIQSADEISLLEDVAEEDEVVVEDVEVEEEDDDDDDVEKEVEVNVVNETENVEESNDEDEVIEKYYNGKKYYITSENNGFVYEADENDEPGSEIGKIINGELILY